MTKTETYMLIAAGWTLAAFVFTVGYVSLASDVAKKLEDQRAADLCIAGLVKLGVPRSEIQVIGPNCKMKVHTD